MAALSLICGMLGCKKTQKSAKHKLSEITSVSISCGHMDQSYGYSFFVHKEDGNLLFDAECFIHDNKTEAVIENRKLSLDEAEELMRLLEQNGSIAYAENYRKPKKPPLQAADETVYSFCLAFSDGDQYVTGERQGDIEEFFYRLAEDMIDQDK